MNTKTGYIIAAILALLLAGCGGGQKKNANPATSSVPVFPSVEIPAAMTDPQAMADFVTEHFWDKFDFSDTVFLFHSDILERQLVEYLIVLPYANDGLAEKSLTKLMREARADSAMFQYFIKQTEHYLWDPNSPYRNDELYIPVLESMLASEKLDEATRLRSVYRLELALKNRIGHTANDFTYTLESGKTARMSQVRSEYLLLFFNNPGCTACAEIIDHAKNSPLMQKLEQEKKNGMPRLTILAVYPDEDLDEWKKYIPNIPGEWINGYDREVEIKRQNLYDLKAIPCLYLLDRDKKVILKDAYIQEVEQYLQQNAGE